MNTHSSVRVRSFVHVWCTGQTQICNTSQPNTGPLPKHEKGIESLHYFHVYLEHCSKKLLCISVLCMLLAQSCLIFIMRALGWLKLQRLVGLFWDILGILSHSDLLYLVTLCYVTYYVMACSLECIFSDSMRPCCIFEFPLCILHNNTKVIPINS